MTSHTQYASFQPYYSWRRMSMPPVAVAAQRPNSDSPTLSSMLSSSSNSNDSNDSLPAVVLAQPYNSNENNAPTQTPPEVNDDDKNPFRIICLIWAMFVTGFVVIWAVFSLYKALV